MRLCTHLLIQFMQLTDLGLQGRTVFGIGYIHVFYFFLQSVELFAERIQQGINALLALLTELLGFLLKDFL